MDALHEAAGEHGMHQGMNVACTDAMRQLLAASKHSAAEQALLCSFSLSKD